MTATGVAKSSSCHPWVDSPLNVPVASSAPVADHRLPVCVPVLSGSLRNRTPDTIPSEAALNFRPSSTPDVSAASDALAGVTSGQMLHGH